MGYFCPFTTLTARKIKILKNWKKTLGDIIILLKCTKNHDHMLYCFWDMVRDGCNYFSFWDIFCPFTTLTVRKIKILKNWKKPLEISSFYTSVPKIMIICCTVPGDIIILHMYAKNYDQMIYGSWDMVRDGRTEKMTYRGGCPT